MIVTLLYETGRMSINFGSNYAFSGIDLMIIKFTFQKCRFCIAKIPFGEHQRDPVFKYI